MRFLCLIVAFSSLAFQLHGMSTVVLHLYNYSGARCHFYDAANRVFSLKDHKLSSLNDNFLDKGCCEYYLIHLNDSENMPKEGHLLVQVNKDKFNLRFFSAEGGSIVPRFDKEVFDEKQNQFVTTQTDFTITKRFDSVSNVYDIFININKDPKLQKVPMEEQSINRGKKNKRSLKSSCVSKFLSKVWH